MIGLTTLVYYAGYTAEGRRPTKNYDERKSELMLVVWLLSSLLTMDKLSLDNDEALIKEIAVIE